MNPEGPVSLVDKDYISRLENYQQRKLIRIGTVSLEYLCELCDTLSHETSGNIDLLYMISVMPDGSLSPLIVAKYDGQHYAALAGITDGVNFK